MIAFCILGTHKKKTDIIPSEYASVSQSPGRSKRKSVCPGGWNSSVKLLSEEPSSRCFGKEQVSVPLDWAPEPLLFLSIGV